MADVELPEEASDPFERLIALSVAILAVVLAFVDNTGNNGQADAIVKTNLASNQWAYYQAKSLKENFASNNAELLTALATNDAAKAKIEELKKDAARYDSEKKEIKDKAEALTKEAEHGQAIDDQCDVAALLLQISVVICSIAILVRWKAIYFVGLAVGAVGIYEGVVAFLM
jgi:FtsZ-binding cell division protein ZapB